MRTFLATAASKATAPSWPSVRASRRFLLSAAQRARRCSPGLMCGRAQWRLNPGLHTGSRGGAPARSRARQSCSLITCADCCLIQRFSTNRSATSLPHSDPPCRRRPSQVYTKPATEFTLSIIHDNDRVVDTIGPVSMAQLKALTRELRRVLVSREERRQ